MLAELVSGRGRTIQLLYVVKAWRAFKDGCVNALLSQTKIALVHGLPVRKIVNLLLIVCGTGLQHKVVQALRVQQHQRVNQARVHVVLLVLLFPGRALLL